ncbi:MAG: ATP-dependent transcriptional regulator, partial [Sulfitobacter sp.]|nr:ATP-dependent transcriptional regulator [Sulfitobacter sp.]
QGWQDHRLAFSHYALGRMLQARAPEQAIRHYRRADNIYASLPEAPIHRAYVGTRMAAFSLNQGQGQQALARLRPHLSVARESENAALLATLMLLEAEALEQTGRVEEARRVRLDSIGWARYGFGADWAVRAKLREIAALNPLN